MEPVFWARAHGAATHFPLVLGLGSGLFDLAGFVCGARPAARPLHAAGYWTMLLGALGSIPAVASGLMMTKGQILGHGALRWHHVFAWPAFGLIVALATWRVLTDGRASRAAFVVYLAGAIAMGGLMAAAAAWGGELMIAA